MQKVNEPSSHAAEVSSLQRQVNSLTFQLARMEREHALEIAKMDQLRTNLVVQRNKRYAKDENLIADLRSERIDLKRSLESVTAQLEAKKHHTQSLQQEVNTLCGKLDAATTRINVLEDAVMRNRPTRSSDDGRRRRARAPTKLAGRSKLEKLFTVINHVPPSRLAACVKAVVADSTNGPSRTPPSPDAAQKLQPPNQHQESGSEGGGEGGVAVA